jgi:hypothetical protein
MSDWRQKLKADPTGWLLEPECSPVRYWMLVDIVDRPPDDPEVRAAQAAIPSYPPMAELLAAQERDGYWVKPDYYLPRASRGTFWVLTVLGDLGLTRFPPDAPQLAGGRKAGLRPGTGCDRVRACAP